MKVESYKELNVWKKGIEIVDCVYRIIEKFPQKELYGLAYQMQRSAISIPSNIAEGFARGHTAEYRQFLRIALGSCAELDTQLIIAHRRNYVTQAEILNLQENLDHESRMIMNLIKSLSKNTKP
jgi:four helix bundle protein